MIISPTFKINLKRIFKTAFQNIWRNKFLSSATIIVMALILFIFNIILVINLTVDKILEDISRKVDIIIYLKDSTDFLQIQNITDEIEQIEGVLEVHYTSKQDALENLLEQYGTVNDPFNKYGLENKLPSNIQIITTSPEYHQKIISFLTNSSYNELFINIESNQETQKIAEKLSDISQTSKLVSLTMLLSFLAGGIIIILNAINLTIYNRKQEIHIMKLVGANLGFIRTPYIIEGIILGASAALLNIILIILLTGQLKLPYQQIEQAVADLQHTALLQLIASGLIGCLGSFIATNKYLAGHRFRKI